MKSVSKDKILDFSELNVSVDDKYLLKWTQMAKSVGKHCGGKGERDANKHFLLFRYFFLLVSFPRVIKNETAWSRIGIFPRCF